MERGKIYRRFGGETVRIGQNIFSIVMQRSVHPVYPRAAFEVPKAPSRLKRKGANAPANENPPLSLSLSLSVSLSLSYLAARIAA